MPLPIALLGLGAIGLIASFIWWSSFYTEILRVTGRLETTKEWQSGVDQFTDCLFWNAPQCVVQKAALKIDSVVPYEPYLLWLSVAIVAAGIVLQLRRAWNAGARRTAPTSPSAQKR